MNARTPPARKRSASRGSGTSGAPTVAPEPARPDRRQAILLAAEKLFAQHGYHAVTIRQIAEEAGVPLALVGYYFGPKHERHAGVFGDLADRHRVVAVLREELLGRQQDGLAAVGSRGLGRDGRGA